MPVPDLDDAASPSPAGIVSDQSDGDAGQGTETTRVYRPSGVLVSGTSLESEPLTTAGDLEFWRQRQAFEAIPRHELIPYAGKFVVSRDGQIIDNGEDLADLSRRSYQLLGDVPVYIAKVGGQIEITVDTPFFD